MKFKIKSILLFCISLMLISCGSTESPSEDPISPIEGQVFTYGAFYDPNEAYESGVLSDQDVMNMAYHINGEQLLDEYWEPIEVDEDKIYPLEDLDSETETKIRKDSYELLLSMYNNTPDLAYYFCRISIYCGNFHGYHAYKFRFYIYGTVGVTMSYTFKVGNYYFHFPEVSDYIFLLWKENK